MSWNFSVLLNDPTNIGGSADGILVYDLQQALSTWSQYIIGIGTLNVQLNITTGGVRESGGPTSTAFVGTNSHGLAAYESSAQYELQTGNHVPGTTSDITINVDQSYFQYLDLVSGLTYGSSVPSNEYNPIDVFMHEIMHGLGMTGFYSQQGTLPGNYESTFDQYISFTSAGAYFTGPHAEAAYGGAVPLTSNSTAGENYYHFGNQQSDLSATPSTVTDPLTLDLMNGIVFFFDHQYPVSALDLGVLQDLGYTIRTTPVAVASNVTATHGQSIAASSLFSISTAPGDTITEYALSDTTGNGHWVVNGFAMGSNQEIDITASQLAVTSYQSGSGADELWVRAYDGYYWSDWKPFTVTAPVDAGATVTASGVTGTHGQTSVAASSLFSASDSDGDTITKYALWDTEGNGHWVVNGFAMGANQEIDITAAQLAQTSYQFGSASDHLYVRAFDGYVWSAWKPFTATPFIDTPPVVTASDHTVTHGQNIAASSLFSASDSDGDAITSYQLSSGADPTQGHWVVGGVAQPNDTNITITAAQLASTSFQSGSGSADLWVRANDGTQWGAWQEFHVTAPVDQPPVVTASNVTATHGETSVAASSLFSASDPEGDTITKYALWDTNGNGHWVVNGFAMGANQEIDITAAQLAQTSYQFGSATDQLYVRAFDGAVWGAWEPYTATPFVDTPPVITASDHTVAHGQNIAASGLFSASDPDGDTVTSYQIWSDADPTHGNWVVGGVAQAVGTSITITAAQLASTSFQSGSGSADLWVRANDGTQWGAWQEFHVIAPVDTGAVVTASDYTATVHQDIAASSLFSASDADGDAVTSYQIWANGGVGASANHWTVGGVFEPTNTNITITAAQLASTTFQNAQGGSSDLWVRAFDGYVWGAWKEFHVNAPVDNGPTVTASDVTVSHGQSITGTSLFSAADADGDPATLYMVDVTSDSSTGHWLNTGNMTTSPGFFATPAQLANWVFQSGSGSATIDVQAYDGYVWGPMNEFHINAPVDPGATINASDVTATHGQDIAASSLFSATTNSYGDPVTSYEIWSGADPSQGHWVVGGVAQATATGITITPSQLASTTFQSASGSADLWVRAYDGYVWGAWKEFHVNAPVDNGPVVTASDVTATQGQDLAASSLFSASDADGDAITSYQLSSGADPSHGNWVVNGFAQPVDTNFTISASQLAATTFQSGSGSADLWARAYDGFVWGPWKEFHVNAPAASTAPVTPAVAAILDQNAAAPQLLLTNNVGDAAAAHQLLGTELASGHWTFDATTAAAVNAVSSGTAAQGAGTAVGGAALEDFWAHAPDGTTAALLQEFHWLLA